MKRSMVLVACLLFLIVGPAARAATFEDPDDMTSPLDIRRLVHTDKGDDLHSFKVTTDDNWGCRYIRPRLAMVRFFFDGRGNNETDLVGRVRCLKHDGGRDLVLFLSGSENSYEPVPIDKPDRHTMKFTFTFDIPEMSGPHASVAITVNDGVAEGCTSAHKCTEAAPDNGTWQLY